MTANPYLPMDANIVLTQLTSVHGIAGDLESYSAPNLRVLLHLAGGWMRKTPNELAEELIEAGQLPNTDAQEKVDYAIQRFAAAGIVSHDSTYGGAVIIPGRRSVVPVQRDLRKFTPSLVDLLADNLPASFGVLMFTPSYVASAASDAVRTSDWNYLLCEHGFTEGESVRARDHLLRYRIIVNGGDSLKLAPGIYAYKEPKDVSRN
jgi:hypothetical protein